MPRIETLSDVKADFESYRNILGLMDWVEKLNFSKRRFEERLKAFEIRLSAHTGRLDRASPDP